MQTTLFDDIQLLNSPEYIFQKFTDGEYLDLPNCKSAMFFAFGIKIKKKKIKEIAIEEKLNLKSFKEMFYTIKKEYSNQLTNHDIILTFYNFLTTQEKSVEGNNTLNYSLFSEKLKSFFPNLSNSYIQEIFVSIDMDKDGVIKLSELHDFLNE